MAWLVNEKFCTVLIIAAVALVTLAIANRVPVLRALTNPSTQ